MGHKWAGIGRMHRWRSLYQQGLSLNAGMDEVFTPIRKRGVRLFIHSQTSTGEPVEVWEWMNDFIPRFIIDVNTYPCQDYIQNMLVKGALSHLWIVCRADTTVI